MDIQKDYSLDDFKVNQDFSQHELVKKQIIKVPVRKPDKSWFVRVHQNEKYRGTFYLLEISDAFGKELYLVASSVSAEIYAEFHQYMKAQTIYTAITKQGDVFLWPIPQPGPDGKDLEWWQTAREAAQGAIEKWSRVVANQNIGGYDCYHAEGNLADPNWPDEDFQSLLLKAFKHRIIDNMDHEALNKLRGMS
ncbi:hypothetical protein [Neobacillus mesonae]|uniref:hypothetical protein n=1 Tax=Neobacillus mesonae TaxID=1193713 RepID=UPI00203A913C|nr:hypothetical protein [Neobacillus mesonae]MCM3567545.1 hypothetical protein [Neobacillus mesonae]